MIPVFRPAIGDEEIRAVTEVLRSGWLGLGPKTAEFEKRFAEWVGAKHAIGVASGTAALHLALAALRIGPGDEVLVPTITFISTAHVVEYVGAKPVFVDVHEDTLCMDVADAERKITERTKAIMPVHYGGRPCDLDHIHRLCEAHGLYLIEDAAHACGARWRDRWIGADSRPFTCFSFHAVKNLTTGEGGMVTTDDDELARELRELRWMGITKDTWDRSTKAQVYAWQYWVKSLGWKAHLSDVAAAIGIAQLAKLERLNDRRRELVARYDEKLKGLPWLQTPATETGPGRSSWHIYHVRTERRDELIAQLKKHDIAPGVHYYPAHLHPYYASRGDARCPVAERVWKKILTLPLFPDLTEQQVDDICGAVRSFASYLEWKRSRLEGHGVVLREVESTDLDRLRGWRNHPEGRRWFFTHQEITADMQVAWFNRYLRGGNELLYVIESPDGKAIGTIGLCSIDRTQGTAELGRMLIGELDERRKGWGERAVRLLLEYAFGTAGLARVFLEVQEENGAARELYRRCGFEEEGVLRGSYVDEGGVRRNKVLMAALR